MRFYNKNKINKTMKTKRQNLLCKLFLCKEHLYPKKHVSKMKKSEMNILLKTNVFVVAYFSHE